MEREIMLMAKHTPEMIKEWESIFEQYKTLLHPNKKSAFEVIEYLKRKYPLDEIIEESAIKVVTDTILHNECFTEKIPTGKTLKIQVFSIKNMGTGIKLYEQQDEVFQGCEIIVGIEHETLFFMVEGSSLLYDELVAFQGLDTTDLNNYFLVTQYISCLKKFNMVDSILTNSQ